MKIIKNTKLVLLVILILAAILRLTLLGNYPAGLTVDEAGQGYSAYSILKTGKDEWGDFFPINPRGFGDYKPPVFMYLLVPSIAIFGLNEFAVRLPSAVAGILTVLLVFYLVRDLLKNKNLALISAFLIAVSPWHIYYSRLGWESNIGLMFFVLGIWLFIKGVEKSKYLSLSVLAFGFSGLSYHSFKLLVPLMVISLIIIFYKQIKSLKTKLIPVTVITLIFASIIGYGFIFSGASRRAEDQSILKEENLSDLRKKQFDDGLPNPLNRIVYNKYQFVVSKIADNYLGYYSLPFLFGPHRSDSSILNFPSLGLLYIWQLPLILVGLWYLIKNRSKEGGVLLSWLLIAPIPASLTQDYMHAGRAQAIFPVLTIISAIGLYSSFKLLKGKRYQQSFVFLSFIIIAFSVFWRIDNYLFHTFNKPLGGLKQGTKEVINFTENQKSNYDKIIFTKTLSEPHAFIGFYGKVDPVKVQNAAVDWRSFETQGYRFLDMTDYKLGKYEFKNIDFHRDRNEKNTLIIASPEEIPTTLNPKFSIKDFSGKTVFVVLDTNEIPQ